MRLVLAVLSLALVTSSASAEPCETVTLPTGVTTVGEAYGAIASRAGRRLMFDAAVRREDEVELDGATLCLDEALALVGLSAGTFHVAPLEGTWLVAPDNQMKRREHEPMVVRSFVLEHVSVRAANALLRGVVDVRKTAVDERANQLTIRDQAETVDLAARILDSMDQPRGQVAVEVVLARAPKGLLDSVRGGRDGRAIVPTRTIRSLLRRDGVTVIADPIVAIPSGETERLGLTDDVPFREAVHRVGFEAVVGAELHPSDDLVTLDVELELSAVPAGASNATRRAITSEVRLAPGTSWVVSGLASAGTGRDASISSARADLARENGARTELLVVLTPRVLTGVDVAARELDLDVGTERRLSVSERRAPGPRGR